MRFQPKQLQTTAQAQPCASVTSSSKRKMNSEVELESSGLRKSEEIISETDKLLAKGKRHLICKEIQDALSVFAELCQKLAEKHGETAEELGEPYLYYGKALLEMARLENQVLGHAFQEGPALEEGAEDEDTDKGSAFEDDDELPEDKREELRNDVEHAMREGNLYNDASTEEEIETEEECDVENSYPEPEDKQKVEDEAISAVGLTPGIVLDRSNIADGEATDDADKENDGNGSDDVTHMHLAWEMFELAAAIYKRFQTPESKSKLAEAKQELGHIGLETEHYEQAVGDFEEALEVQKQIYDADDRRIAESCYNIGLAHSFDNKFSESIFWFKKAADVLDSRIKNLDIKITHAENNRLQKEASTELDEWTREVNELKDLVMLDLMSKIEDATESKKQEDESLKTIKEMAKDVLRTSHCFDSAFDSLSGHVDAPSESNDNGVRDITSTVRKRKHDEKESSTDLKKAKSAGNGHVEHTPSIARAEA